MKEGGRKEGGRGWKGSEGAGWKEGGREGVEGGSTVREGRE